MNKNVEKFEQIEAFIQGNLSDLEKAKIEQQILDNMDFKKEVIETASTIKGIEAWHEAQFREKLNDYHADMLKNKRRIGNRQWLLMVASLVVLVSAVWIFTKNSINTTSNGYVPELLSNDKSVAIPLDNSPKTYPVKSYMNVDKKIAEIEINIEEAIKQKQNALVVTPYYFYTNEALSLYGNFEAEKIGDIYFDKANMLYYLEYANKVYAFETTTNTMPLLRVHDDCILQRL